MKITLTSLQKSFAEWYSSSPKKRYSNASLREQAVKCLSDHTHREISEAIGIPINTLRSWKRSLHFDQRAVKTPSEFIAIDLDDTNVVQQTPLTLQISLPNGISIKIDPKNIASSVELIVALNKEPKPCSI